MGVDVVRTTGAVVGLTVVVGGSVGTGKFVVAVCSALTAVQVHDTREPVQYVPRQFVLQRLPFPTSSVQYASALHVAKLMIGGSVVGVLVVEFFVVVVFPQSPKPHD